MRLGQIALAVFTFNRVFNLTPKTDSTETIFETISNQTPDNDLPDNIALLVFSDLVLA